VAFGSDWISMCIKKIGFIRPTWDLTVEEGSFSLQFCCIMVVKFYLDNRCISRNAGFYSFEIFFYQIGTVQRLLLDRSYFFRKFLKRLEGLSCLRCSEIYFIKSRRSQDLFLIYKSINYAHT
jgi:hypothetical protein